MVVHKIAVKFLSLSTLITVIQITNYFMIPFCLISLLFKPILNYPFKSINLFYQLILINFVDRPRVPHANTGWWALEKESCILTYCFNFIFWLKNLILASSFFSSSFHFYFNLFFLKFIKLIFFALNSVLSPKPL